MSDALLVINAGSSSIKFALFALVNDSPAERPALTGQVAGIGSAPRLSARDGRGRPLIDRPLGDDGVGSRHHRALEALLGWIRAHDEGLSIIGVGHRVVHGGDHYAAPVGVDPTVLEVLDGLVPLAPLHQPHNLDAIRTLAHLLPGVHQVACFDTAFHRSQPELAQLFALPRRLSEGGLRRYGFHGLSYEYIADALPKHLAGGGAEADGRVVVAHLGNGASMCAMRERRSVATTMGFTALEGLMMGTRCGAIDPGVLLYLMQYRGYDAESLTNLLYRESGLLGVSGISSDMGTLLASGETEARQAIDLFCYRVVRELGSLAAALGGLDTLVFTGGIGEHAAEIRTRICSASAWLGIDIDDAANSENAIRISTSASRINVLALATDEETIIARHTARLLNQDVA